MGTFNYQYDYRTRRILRDESLAGGTITALVYSGGTSVAEYPSPIASSPSPTLEFIRGSDYGGGVGGILYTIRSGVASFTHADKRGDIVSKTNASGAITYQAAYQAFGTRTVETGSTLDRQKGNSKDEDPTGLLDEGFRYRDLDSGTFITKDPMGFVDGPNVYTYVRHNPWTSFDPEGLSLKDDAQAFFKPAVDFAKPYVDKAKEILKEAANKVGKSAKQLAQDAAAQLKSSQPARSAAALADLDSRIAQARQGADRMSLLEERYGSLNQIPDDVLNNVPGMSEATQNLVGFGGFIETYAPWLTPGGPGGGGVGVMVDAEKVAAKEVTYLYQKLGPSGEHLKFGITNNPVTRYTKKQLAGGRLNVLTKGSREEMLQLERNLHETLPLGPEEAQKFYIQKQVDKGLVSPPYSQ